MISNDSLVDREALAALDRVVAGADVANEESETLDFKEDPSRRDELGRPIAGGPVDDDAARLVADAAACLSNHHGGTVVVGVDDKGAGMRALRGTSLRAGWLRRRIRELTTPPLTTGVVELGRGPVRLLAIDVPRNEGSEPFAASVSKRGGQRRARRIGTDCHEMTTVAEMLEWARERSGYDWSAQPSGRPLAAVRAGALEAIRDLLRESGEPDRVALADSDDPDLLRQLQVLRPDDRLTHAGELLLCASTAPRIVYTHRPAQGARSITRVAAPGRGLAEELRATLDRFDASNRSLPVPGSGIAEGVVEALPRGVVREALVNGIMHRDWERPDPILADHAGDELIVFSPGKFLEGITEHTVLTAPSRTRNRHLGDVLRSLRIAEREGTGVDRMFIELIRLGHRPPTFTERDDGVRVTLQGGEPVPAILRVHATLPEALRRSARTAVALHLLRARPSFTAAELAHAAQEEESELLAFIDAAVAEGLLTRTARARRGGTPAWRLADRQREVLGPVLPYYARPAEESVQLIAELARQQAEVRNHDVQDVLGLTSARASQLLKRAQSEGAIRLGPRSSPIGRGTYYVPGVNGEQ